MVKKIAVKKPIVKKIAKKAAVKKAAVKKTSAKRKAPKKPIRTLENDLILAMSIAQGMYEKKASDIRILDLRNIAAASTNYFVISHASNDKQVDAIAKSAEEIAKKTTGDHPLHREGFENLEWVLLDYFTVVASVFQKEKREFYALEELWGDALDVKFEGK